MSRFKKKKGGGTPAMSTASLPDIVFMLLFFFMVTTVMRETTLIVENSLPKASEIKKIEDKSLCSYIYVGAPVSGMKTKFGTEPRIQLNDSFKLASDIQEFVAAKREATAEEKKPQLITCIKADVDAKMGLITDIKQELRKAQAFKINYATYASFE
ncbi:MAG: biopolymer transporter ExbD [Flavobacteriales bacterium]|nr:biopolymer transporter ExbD [Flavobacteriales bacterium]MDG1395791.1 biopolymer transporter ExbD [Flavobacteriales bacterium]|tara:strand:+ start:855 stop:1322 length:468 start_codon:yes stop_codon:yes gene_type:complete